MPCAIKKSTLRFQTVARSVQKGLLLIGGLGGIVGACAFVAHLSGAVPDLPAALSVARVGFAALFTCAALCFPVEALKRGHPVAQNRGRTASYTR